MKLLILTVALLAVLACHVDAQRRLSRPEMVRLFGYQKYDYPNTNKIHTCAYLSLKGNAFTGNRAQYAHLECNCVRKISDCGGGRLRVLRKCCPGFKSFRDGRETRCMERVLPLNTFQNTLKNINAGAISTVLFDSAYGAKFNESMGTYTVFAVRNADGFRTSSVTRRQTSVSNYASSTFVHVAKGRVYTQALNQEQSISTLHKRGAKNTDIKFTRYSNGIMCVECSVIKEANFEAANGVIHVVDSPFFASSASKTIAQTLQADYGYFWSALSRDVKAKLSGTSCDGWYTVFVPSQSQWNSGNAAIAANHVIQGLWCTHGLVSQNSANLATLAGDVLQLGCSGNSREQILISSNGRNARIDSSQRGRTFDRMASNGVIHVVTGRLEPRSSLSFRFAVQLEQVEAGEPKNSLYYEFNSCGIEFQANKKYIVLVPTLAAMNKFYKHRNTNKDAEQYLRSENSRCQLLRYHILIAEDGLTDLERVMHLQKTYTTMLGNDVKITDFLVASGDRVTPFFMYAKSTSSQEFANGHIYEIDNVLLPPIAKRWASVMAGHGLADSVVDTLTTRLRNLAVMEQATPAGQQCTHFVPPETDLDDEDLVQHSARYSLWTNYMRNGDTLEMPPCDESTSGSKLLLHRVSRTRYTLSFVGSNKKVSVLNANILRSTGTVWFINGALSQ